MKDPNMKRAIIAIAVLLAVSAIIAIPIILAVQRSNRYNAARTLMGNGEYEAAIEQFSGFEADYKSTESLLNTCRVSLRAQALLDEGKAAEALALCKTEGIEDTDMGWQCKFEAALITFNRRKASGDYQGAEKALRELDEANFIVKKLTDDELDDMRDKLGEDMRLNSALENGDYRELFTIYTERDDMDSFDKLRFNEGSFSRADIVQWYLEEQGDTQRARKWADAAFALKAYEDAFDAYLLLGDHDQALLAVQADGSFQLHTKAIALFSENGDTAMLEKALALGLDKGMHSYVFSYYVDHDELEKAAEILTLWMNKPEPLWDSSAHNAAHDLDLQSNAGSEGASRLRQTMFDQFKAIALSYAKSGEREKAYLLCNELSDSFGDEFDAKIEDLRQSCTFDFPATGVIKRSDGAAGKGVTLHLHNKSSSKGALFYLQGSSSSGLVVIGVFLRPNDNYTITLAPGEYRADVTAGKIWFGDEEHFGKKSKTRINVNIPTPIKPVKPGIPSHSGIGVHMEGEYSLTIPG